MKSDFIVSFLNFCETAVGLRALAVIVYVVIPSTGHTTHRSKITLLLADRY